MKGRQPTAKQRRFISALLKDPDGGHIEAAKKAGYAYPGEVGLKLLRRLGPWIEEEREKSKPSYGMTPQDIIKGFEEIAQDMEHRDRFNALKALAQIHKLDDPNAVQEGARDEISAVLQTFRGATPIALQPRSQRRLPRA